jgi:hypothetical protein
MIFCYKNVHGTACQKCASKRTLPLALGWTLTFEAMEEDIMNNLSRIARPLIAVAIMSSVPSITLAQNSPAGNQTQINTTQNPTTPSPEKVQTQPGYRDGMEAAKLDKLTNRKIDARSSHLYLHPPVKGNDAVNAYRSTFEAGYGEQVKATS